MPVTDTQVATLRAFLAGDMAEHKRLSAELANEPKAGYMALIAAAFWEAVERRFPTETPRSEVIDFVSNTRTRALEAADLLDPKVSEQMILAVITDESISDLDNETVVSHEVTLLSALIADEQLDDAGLDAFLNVARTVADQIAN
ncbi:MAG TPA: hypothetical protein VGL93_11025 [Streptosporangiaceae bacterium]